MGKKRQSETSSPELGATREERSRHLRYAHEQYSASSQGPLGAPKGRNLPLEKPQRNAGAYPPGTKMPWPSDADVEAEMAKPRRRRR